MHLLIKGLMTKYLEELQDCFGDLLTVYKWGSDPDLVDVDILEAKIQNIGNRILILDRCYDMSYCVYIHRPDFIEAVIR